MGARDVSSMQGNNAATLNETHVYKCRTVGMNMNPTHRSEYRQRGMMDHSFHPMPWAGIIEGIDNSEHCLGDSTRSRHWCCILVGWW